MEEAARVRREEAEKSALRAEATAAARKRKEANEERKRTQLRGGVPKGSQWLLPGVGRVTVVELDGIRVVCRSGEPGSGGQPVAHVVKGLRWFTKNAKPVQ